MRAGISRPIMGRSILMNTFSPSRTTALAALSLLPTIGLAQTSGLEEIVVTATRRTQTLQDAPISVAAVSAADIEAQTLVGMQDYLNTVPGVTYQDFGVGRNQIVIRGVGSSLFEEATVGVYFDEVPLTAIGEGSQIDLKLVDMDRIEVLRGPQGTLFGAASLGGSVRNIPASPLLGKFSAAAHATYSNTGKFGSSNYEAWGALNLPLAGDKFAVRVVGYDYNDSGYIHNVGATVPALVALANQIGGRVTNRDDVGSSEYAGGRVTALWQPSEALSFKLTYVNQQLESDGFNEVDISLPQGG
jgi:iron complex outermembrane receptor protein